MVFLLLIVLFAAQYALSQAPGKAVGPTIRSLHRETLRAIIFFGKLRAKAPSLTPDERDQSLLLAEESANLISQAASEIEMEAGKQEEAFKSNLKQLQREAEELHQKFQESLQAKSTPTAEELLQLSRWFITKLGSIQFYERALAKLVPAAEMTEVASSPAPSPTDRVTPPLATLTPAASPSAQASPTPEATPTPEASPTAEATEEPRELALATPETMAFGLRIRRFPARLKLPPPPPKIEEEVVKPGGGGAVHGESWEAHVARTGHAGIQGQPGASPLAHSKYAIFDPNPNHTVWACEASADDYFAGRVKGPEYAYIPFSVDRKKPVCQRCHALRKGKRSRWSNYNPATGSNMTTPDGMALPEEY